jgi:hypothetical protein
MENDGKLKSDNFIHTMNFIYIKNCVLAILPYFMH